MTLLDCDIGPGIYPDLSMEDYHSSGGVSSTLIRKCSPTLAHGLAYLDEDDDDEGFNMGTAVHTAVLEPDIFDRVYDNRPPEEAQGLHHTYRKTARLLGSGMTVPQVAEERETKVSTIKGHIEKPGVQKLRVWYMHNNPDEIVEASVEKIDEVKRARDAVFRHPVAADMLADGRPEVSYFWEDESGLTCRCRPDFVTAKRDLVDIKTYSSAEEREFQRQIGRLGYQIQGALYLDGVDRAGGPRCDYFFFIVVDLSLATTEIEENACKIYRLGSDSIGRGLDVCRRRLDELGRWHRGEEKNAGYSTEIETIEAPEWA